MNQKFGGITRRRAGSRTIRPLCLALMLGMATLNAASAVAVIQPGEVAPPFELPGSGGAPFILDGATTDPTLLMFLKPGDQYTSASLEAMDDLFERTPLLTKNLRRAVILTRMRDAEIPQDIVDFLEQNPEWTLLVDKQGKLYKAYRIIATPTFLLIDGADRIVKAVHAGYDPGMEQALRLALANELGVELPPTQVERPNMRLQIARRLASRNLWERSLDYYHETAAEDALTSHAQLEMAEVLLELNQPEPALKLLELFKGQTIWTDFREYLARWAQAILEKQPPENLPAPLRLYDHPTSTSLKVPAP